MCKEGYTESEAVSWALENVPRERPLIKETEVRSTAIDGITTIAFMTAGVPCVRRKDSKLVTFEPQDVAFTGRPIMSVLLEFDRWSLLRHGHVELPFNADTGYPETWRGSAWSEIASVSDARVQIPIATTNNQQAY